VKEEKSWKQKKRSTAINRRGKILDSDRGQKNHVSDRKKNRRKRKNTEKKAGPKGRKGEGVAKVAKKNEQFRCVRI